MVIEFLLDWFYGSFRAPSHPAEVLLLFQMFRAMSWRNSSRSSAKFSIRTWALSGSTPGRCTSSSLRGTEALPSHVSASLGLSVYRTLVCRWKWFLQHLKMFQVHQHDSWRPEASSPLAPDPLPPGDSDSTRCPLWDAQPGAGRARAWCEHFAFLQQSRTYIISD